MLKARKRLARLEASLLPNPAATIEDTIFSKTSRRMTTPDLVVLIATAEANAHGKRSSELTDRELSALAAYVTVLQEELLSAGISSLAEFERLRGRRR